MKNFTLTVFFAFACAFAIAQDSIANGGFESWGFDGPYNDPNNWSTTNSVTGPSAGFYNCFLDSTVVHSGNYSCRVQTAFYSSYGPVPGILTTGKIDIISQAVYSGETIHSRPLGVTGWVLYVPAGSDTGGISVNLISGDSIVGTGSLTWKDSVNSWTQFYCPVTYSSGTIPDTAQITFNSSVGRGTKYTNLWIDDVSYYYYPAGIKEVANTQISIYPNPANNEFTVDNGTIQAKVLNLYATDGKLIKGYNLHEGVNTLGLTGISSGVYMVRAIGSTGSIYTNSLVVSK